MGVAFKRKRWREAQRLRVDVNGMMAHLIGEAGLADGDVEGIVHRLDDLSGNGQRRAGALGEAPPKGSHLQAMLTLTDRVRGEFDDLVLLGCDGAAVAARALAGMLAPPGAGGRPSDGAMRLHTLSTVDPTRFSALLAGLDLRRTLFNVISAAGDSAATLSQFLVVRDRLLKELGAVEYKRHVVVSTDPAEGALRQIVNDEGFHDLTMASQAGGTLAILGATGLFPAACAGVDVAEVLAGAADLEARVQHPDPGTNPALQLGATLFLACVARGATVALAPYADALVAVGEWFDCLWMERVGAPLRMGAGPRSGVTVFLRVEEHETDLDVPQGYEDLEIVACLGGLKLGALRNLEQQSAEVALARAGRMSATVVCPRLNAFVAGELLHLLATTVALVKALDVTEGAAEPIDADLTELTAGLAGRPGYEGKRAEVQRWLARKEARYVV